MDDINVFSNVTILVRIGHHMRSVRLFYLRMEVPDRWRDAITFVVPSSAQLFSSIFL